MYTGCLLLREGSRDQHWMWEDKACIAQGVGNFQIDKIGRVTGAEHKHVVETR